jgi:hypothetical protein
MRDAARSPRTIFIIRHGEKPAEKMPPNGIDAQGVVNGHSLLPLGWQRAGALAVLFDPHDGKFRPGIVKPTQLIAPDYPPARKQPPEEERTHQTIQPLADRLGLVIESNGWQENFSEAALGEALAKAKTGVTLVCWEHTNLPKIANAICPNCFPGKWPGKRFDIILSFTLVHSGKSKSPPTYSFTQIPQRLLEGDKGKLKLGS